MSGKEDTSSVSGGRALSVGSEEPLLASTRSSPTAPSNDDLNVENDARKRQPLQNPFDGGEPRSVYNSPSRQL